MLYANTALDGGLADTVCALDSGTIDLCLSLCPRANMRTTKAALRLLPPCLRSLLLLGQRPVSLPGGTAPTASGSPLGNPPAGYSHQPLPPRALRVLQL